MCHRELLTANDEFLTTAFDRIFGYQNFQDIIISYTLAEITQFISSYLLAFNNHVVTQVQIIEYLTNRKHWSGMFEHFKQITVGGEQHSNDWFVERNKRITASSISTVIKSNTKSRTYNKLLCEKFNPSAVRKYRGSPATIWGTMFEQVAREIYSQKNKVNVMEYGLIPHMKYDFIGASPDGVTDIGVLLEIKCPYSRNITNKIPKHYYAQIQHQLEVCDYEKCHYGEFVFRRDIDDKHWLESFKYDDTTIRGVILVFTTIDKNYEYHELYEYSPLLENNNDYKHIMIDGDWVTKITEQKTKMIEESQTRGECELLGVEEKRWALESYNVKTVERSREWFADALPQMEEFINKVKYYKGFTNPMKQFQKDTGFDPNPRKTEVHDDIPDELIL
jgi:putative phage-type endonuclease